MGPWKLALLLLFMMAASAQSADKPARQKRSDEEPRIVYPKSTRLNFEDLGIEGELRNPGDFYFQHRTEERFGSLIKRRENFHIQMLRDAVMTK